MRNRFVIDNDVGCLIDNLDELPTIHFSDKVDFFELYEFLNRQENRIDQLKTCSSDPFAKINSQLKNTLHTTAQDFLRDYKVMFTDFTMSMDNNFDFYHSTYDKGFYAIPSTKTGKVTFNGVFMGRR